MAYLCSRQSIWGESAHFHEPTRNAQYHHGPERRHAAAGMHRWWPVSRRKWKNGALLGWRMANVHLTVLFEVFFCNHVRFFLWLGQVASIDLHKQFKSVWLYCVFQSNARYLLEQGERGPAKRTFFISQFPENSEITEVTEADGGDYRCLAKNRLGSNHHIITVVVRGLSQDVFSSVTSQKSCLVTSFTDPGMPSWTVHGLELIWKNLCVSCYSENTHWFARYLKIYDEIILICCIGSILNSIFHILNSNFVCLILNFPFISTAAPFWISAPQNLILAPKESGMLTCRAEGNPKPTVTWSVNGIPIERM